MDDADIRLKLVGQINEAMANLEIAKKRVRDTEARHQKLRNDMRADIGTAMSQVEKIAGELAEHSRRLQKLLPPADAVAIIGAPAARAAD